MGGGGGVRSLRVVGGGGGGGLGVGGFYEVVHIMWFICHGSCCGSVNLLIIFTEYFEWV